VLSLITDKKIVDTPLETSVRYFLSNGVPWTDSTLYQTIVGSLVYLSVTRPDIAHVTNVFS